MSRKNSKELIDINKKNRSLSISSFGSIETIELEDDSTNVNKKNRRKREVNVEEYERINTPDVLTVRKLLYYFKNK